MKLINKAGIENTTYCGANCIMCPRDLFEHKHSFMSLEDFKSYFTQCVELGAETISIGGFGEPMCDNTYCEKLEWSKKTYPNVKNFFTTTGQLLTGKLLDATLEYIDAIRISNYGMTKETYEKVHRGSLNFEKCQKNINDLLEKRDKNKLNVSMSFLKLPENEHEMESWKEYWEPKVDDILIWNRHNFTGAVEDEGTKILTKPKNCGRVDGNGIVIHPNGEISVCCFDFNRKLIIGSLKEKSLKEILLSDEFNKIKNIHKEGAFENCGLICETCDQIHDRSDALIYTTMKDKK